MRRGVPCIPIPVSPIRDSNVSMFQGGYHDSKSALLAIVPRADPSGTSRGDSTAIKFRCYQQGGSRTPRIHSAIRRGATESRRRDRRAVLGCRICLYQSGRRTRVARRANRKPARESRTSFDSLTHAPEEEVIHVYMDGNMAVYTARLKIDGRYSGHPEHGEFRALDAWIRRDGRWQQLASQLTAIHK